MKQNWNIVPDNRFQLSTAIFQIVGDDTWKIMNNKMYMFLDKQISEEVRYYVRKEIFEKKRLINV